MTKRWLVCTMVIAVLALMVIPTGLVVSPVPARAASLQIDVNYAGEWVAGVADPDAAVEVFVYDSSWVLKGDAVVTADGSGDFFVACDDWFSGECPDIVPGDRVSVFANETSAHVDPVGELAVTLDASADTVSGTLYAPWFAGPLSISCEVWESSGPTVSTSAATSGGTFTCDFSGSWDLLAGQSVAVRYTEPDGDSVINVPEWPPTSVTVAGSLQSELGCPGDWQPDCAATHLTYDVNDGIWQGVFAVPAGDWEYKAALNNSWDENYGANATQNGANIPLSVAAPTDVKFYYDHETHWITDSINSVIATLPGSYQSELGCPGDWQPDCLHSWLQDPDGDGNYLFSTTAIPPGSYEVKVAIDESWDENYGAGGLPNGANIPFTVAVEDSTVVFSYDPVSHLLSISVLPANTPPVANSDSATTLEDTPVTVDVLANDVDSDGDMLSVATATDGTWGETAPITSLNTITYTPDPDYHGSDSFTYMVCDTHGACDWGTVFVTVTAVNDPPVANDDVYTTAEDTILTVAAPGVLGNDTDADGDPLQGAGWTWYEPFGGTAIVSLDGSFQFVPDPNVCGESVWTYQATDGIAQSDWADVAITVNCVNDPPTADANGPYVGMIGVPVSFDGTGSSDPENGVETFDWDFGDGSPVGADAGATPTHTYATAASYTVTLTVTDDGGLTDTATTNVAITLGSESFDAVEATIEGMGLESAGFENSLLQKIQNAQKSFDKADGEVCEKLASFIAAVNAQDGKKLTAEQADLLRSQAEAISGAYGCVA